MKISHFLPLARAVVVLGLLHGAAAQSLPAGSHPSRTPAFHTPVPATSPRPEFFLPDEPIRALAIHGNRLYIGGSFTQVGPYTGPFAVVGATSGVPNPSWPRTNGSVSAVIGDNYGGWYVGGLFTKIGGQTRSNLAHVFANGTIDTFAPVVGTQVYSLALDHSTLYVGGSFQEAGGQPRSLIAALDATSGAALPFAPITQHMGSSERVTTIVVDGSTVYFGGYFDSPAVYPRRHLAAVNATTGALITAFNPNPDGSVFDVVLSGYTLYAGGGFAQIGGAPRGRLAGLDKATGVVVGPLNPNIIGGVAALALSGDTLYVGGGFTSASAQPRSCGAAFDTTTGSLLAWDPQAAIPDQTSLEILDLAVGPQGVYAAGSFRSIGGQRQLGVARLDATSGNALSWSGDAAGPDSTEVACVALQGNDLACGGNFAIMGGERREGAAALDLATGQLTPWRPEVHGQLGALQIGDVLEILVSGNTAWLGGQFSYVNGVTCRLLASVDTVTGATNNAFAPGFFHPGDFVGALALRGTALFAGGSFHTPISGQENLIALDATTGAIVPGSTGAGPTVYDLALSADESRLYLCGQIAGVGNPSVPRNYLAAIDPTDGSVLPWDPNPNQIVVRMEFFDDRLWVAGEFLQIGGQPHGGVAAIDPITGVPWPAFAPLLQHSGVTIGAGALARFERTLLVGGSFDTVNGQPRNFMAAFDSADGRLLGWNPIGATAATDFALADGVLAVTGGTFTYPSGEARPFLAVYDAR